MATGIDNLPAPTSILQEIERDGVRFISFDGVTWSLYQVNMDNPSDTGTSTSGTLTDSQRAQLIAQRSIPDGTTGTVSTGTWLRYTEGSTQAYRLILSTGASRYSLTQPT